MTKNNMHSTFGYSMYESYKDSGVEWLGEIPEHWEMKRFKFLAKANKGKLPKNIVSTNDTKLPPYMSMEYLRGGEENQWVKDNDALIIDKDEILLLWDGSNSGEFLKSRKGVISSTVAHILYNNIEKKFAWYHSKVLEIVLRRNTIGMGIPHVNGRVLNNLTMLLPPLTEQTKIAQFLDDKTTKIDDAVAIKEQQIQLLKERKQILIHKAVTRGLDNSVALKDSGVEWIGEIPVGWEVKRIKHTLLKSFSGGTPSTDVLSYWDGGISWISSVDLKVDRLEKTAREISPKGLAHSSSKLAPKESVVFVTRSGILQHTFPISILGKEMAINQDIKCLVFTGKLYPKYFQKIILGNNDRILVEVRQQAATVESIDMDAFYNLPIPFPPLSEQKDITAYIESASQKIETAIDLKQQEIGKLKEYKSSLINGVVTGKVKVS